MDTILGIVSMESIGQIKEKELFYLYLLSTYYMPDIVLNDA